MPDPGRAVPTPMTPTGRTRPSRTMAIDALMWALRPPDRDPPRLASLTAEQEAVIVAVLDELAFAPDSVYQADAMQVLEEWWIPNALYRPRSVSAPTAASRRTPESR